MTDTVMVFGVFDGCDKGHRYFLRTAAKLGDALIVVVARDEIVEELKGKCPAHTTEERIAAIEKLGIATAVIPGDKEHHSWRVVEHYKPDIVALGHDQDALKDALIAAQHLFEIKRIDEQNV